MANVTKTNATRLRQFGGTPYGNAIALKFLFETNAAGVMVDSDKATAVAVGDVVRIGVLPAGLDIHDSLAIISDAFTALTTANIGFAYVDGVDDALVPQNATYFNAALSTNSPGRAVASNNAVKPVILPKDAYVTLTVAGANHASIGRLDFIVNGVWTGVPSANP